MLKWFQTMLKKSKEEKGFSLIELMIVVAIIGILFVVLVPKLDGTKNRAKAAGVTTDMRSFQMAVTAYVDSLTAAPKSFSANAASYDPYLDQPTGVASPYMTNTNDPWGSQYTYVRTDGTANDDFCLILSEGPNGTTGSLTLSNAGVVGNAEPDDIYMVLKVDDNTGKVTLFSKQGF